MYHPELDHLYASWVGIPNPARWEAEYKESPMWAHGCYSFQQGLRPGFALGLLLGPGLNLSGA